MKQKNLRRSFLIPLLVTLFVNSVFILPPVLASSTTLYINPQNIINENLTPCNNITITINIENVTDLYGYELILYYNRSILSAVRAVRPSGHFLEPQIDPANQYVAKWEIRNNFNDTHGRLWLAYTLLAPETGRTGSGTLIEITFHVEGIGSTPITFKETILGNSQAQNIPHQTQDGYFSNTPPPPPPPPPPEINVTVINFTPDPLNLGFKKGYFTAYIELPTGFDVNNINVSTILLNDTIPVNLAAPSEVGDYDNDGILDLTVNFDRNLISNFILNKGITYGNITLKITFNLDGTPFETNQTIQVRMPGDTNIDGKVNISDVIEAARAFGASPGHPRWNHVADENEDNIISLFDLILIVLNFGKQY
jgi:hypothetical protein